MKKWLIIAGALCAVLVFPIAGDAQPFSNNPTGVSPNQMFGCNHSAFYDASTNGATQLVASQGNAAQIYVCGWNFFASGTVNVGLVYGTGTNCAIGTTKITPAFQFGAQTGDVDHLPVWTGITPVPNGSNLCINTSGGLAVQAVVYWTQF